MREIKDGAVGSISFPFIAQKLFVVSGVTTQKMATRYFHYLNHSASDFRLMTEIKDDALDGSICQPLRGQGQFIPTM